jgi:hypothetical protein
MVTRTFKIYEIDIYDSLVLLVRLIESEGLLPSSVEYHGVEDDHAVWVVTGYVSDS